MTSGMQITPLRRADIPELSQFLTSGFGVPASSSLFSHEVLLWKYFDGPGGPSGDLVHSLVARSAGKIVGHVGICPRQFIVSGDGAAPVSTMHAIDWLGSREHAGLGALFDSAPFATCKTQYAIDGSAQAQALFPRLGFEAEAQARRLSQGARTIPGRLRLQRIRDYSRKWCRNSLRTRRPFGERFYRRCHRPSNCASNRHLHVHRRN